MGNQLSIGTADDRPAGGGPARLQHLGLTEPNSSDSATPPFAPDSVAIDQNHVFIDYQNKTAKDCTDATTTHSTVSEYSMDGKFVHSWNVPGHSDGMRIDPSTHLIWTTSCEDGNPITTNTNGDLVLIDQGDSQYITISSPGTASQKVTRTQVGDQLDDTVWANGEGRLLVTDGVSNFTYRVDGLFSNGTIITQAPNDSGVTNFLGTVDPSTGYVTPFAIGFGKATGMIWVPSALAN